MHKIRLQDLFVLMLGLCLAACGQVVSETAPVQAVRRANDIILPLDVDVVDALVPRNATLASILHSHQVSNRNVAAIVEQVDAVFDVRQIKAQHQYRLTQTLDGLPRQFEYHIDSDRFLSVKHAGFNPDTFLAEIVPYVKERAVLAMRGDIDETRTSLVAAINDSGEQVQLAMSMADVLGGEIDFNNDLRRGDRFQVVFEKFFREDQFAGYGDVLAAAFDNNGRRIRAFLYTPPDGKPGYYDENGNSLKRLFLRSPLRFEPRITSRFSRNRMHPILGERRAHLGVDYGAPTGTPVIAVANGVVLSAAMSGASGRMVRLRHSGGYETYYLHLSSFGKGIRKGVRVDQGQLVGRVGATGLVTGPHLDYRLKKNGVFVNPLVEHRKMPPGDPIPKQHLADFKVARDRMARLFPDELVLSIEGTVDNAS